MNYPQCEREQEVVDAVRSGRWAGAWGEEIRRHAAVCPVCAEVAEAALAFQQEVELAGAEFAPQRLPSAGLIWWKSQLAARRAAEQRAAQPIVLVERIALTFTAMAAVVLGVWQRARLAGWLNQFLASGAHAATPAGYSTAAQGLYRMAQAWTAQTSPILLAAAAAAFLTFVVVTAYLVWREE